MGGGGRGLMSCWVKFRYGRGVWSLEFGIVCFEGGWLGCFG